MTIEAVNQSDFDDRVNQASQPIVLDFWQAACPPCQMLEPKLEAVARQFAGRVTVYRLDVEESPAIAERYNVMSIPTLLVIKAGEVSQRLDGLITQDQLRVAFEEALA